MIDTNQNSAEKPLVSIIVPVYKVETYLKQCVDSLLGQTLENIEIILVDDGSPDNCPVMCDAYAEQDKRVKVIHQQNGGYGKACNSGIACATGEYIGIVESDDYVELDMFETLYSAVKYAHSPIIKASFFHEYQDGTNHICSLGHITKNEKICTLQAKDSLYLMVYESSIWSAIYKRDFVVENKIQMLETRGASYQDVVWKFAAYIVAESITLIDKPVYHYRVLTQHSSSKNKKNYNAMFVNYAEIKRILDSTGKFEQFCKSYYLHQFFDADFHFWRLDKQGRKKFNAKMRKVINESKQKGITIESFPDFDVPLYVRERYYEIISGKKSIKNAVFNRLKQICLTFYRTRTGTFLWNCLRKTVNNRYIKKVLLKLLGYSNVISIPGEQFVLDQIFFPKSKKNALVLMPFWGRWNAVCMNVTEMGNILHRMGYTLHLVVYSFDRTMPLDPLWEYIYALKPMASNFGLSHPVGGDMANLDANLIDDWVGDDLLAFIKLLNQNCHFDLCLCNYVFLSKVLTCFNDTTKKIIYTHDIFSGRNKRMHDIGINSFYFGTVLEEEKKGLNRADYVIAIQKKEQIFFQNLTNKPVITMPYIPPKKYKNLPFIGSPLKVGYIASYHGPNILAIKEYVKLLENEKRIELFIAGPISEAIKQRLPNVHVLGIVESLDEFYSQYDVYANPDLIESGLKVKTVEAFSYGRPVICTKAASAGIDVAKAYHQCESLKEIAEITKACLNNPMFLTEMAEESKRVFDAFYATYPTHEIMKKIVSPA